MLYGRYDFRCRFQSDAHLPLYKGSTFRGVFGHALKSVLCALRRQTCDTCLLKSQCLYTMVFETHLAVSPPAGARIATAPHPFVIRPPLTTQTGFEKDDIFIFSLLLFGGVNQYFTYFIYAFDSMGKLGVGKKISGQRASFILDTVFHENKIIYTKKNQTLQMDGAPPRLTLSDPPEEVNSKNRVTIQLKTPLRLKFKNRYTAELPFHILTRAMLRRVSILLTFYNGGEPPLDYRGLIKRAEAVRMIDSKLCLYEWDRYSNRQKQKTPMGGMVGTVTYEGALSEFWPLIEFCEKTNIGKQTAFGLGEIAVVKRT
jgi:hypothetical protein